MSVNKRGIRLTVVALLGFAALISGLFVAQHVHQSKKINPDDFHGTLLEAPREINAFAMTGTDGKPFTNASLKGQWTLVFFGFTNCGYLCPTTMGELGKVYRKLEAEAVKPLPRVVMISVDPDRDTLEKLANYVKTFDVHFYGARGDEASVRNMTRELGIAYAKVDLPNAEKNNYDMQHSGALMLFNPEGQLTAFFTTPHQTDLLVKDYQLLVQ